MRFVTNLMLAVAALASVCPRAGAQQYLVNTGAGTPAPNMAEIGGLTGQDRTYGQFTLAQDSYFTGIEFYGQLVTGGVLQLLILNNDAANLNEPGSAYYSMIVTVTGTPGTIGWFGSTDLGNVVIPAGTYWVGDGTGSGFRAIQYGSAPMPLGNESVRNALSSSYNDADSLDLSWRISGRPQAAAVLPETATWTMMIVGAGAVGATVRHRKRGATAAARA